MLHITGGGLSHRGGHDHHNSANTVLSAQTKVKWDEKIIHNWLTFASLCFVCHEIHEAKREFSIEVIYMKGIFSNLSLNYHVNNIVKTTVRIFKMKLH